MKMNTITCSFLLMVVTFLIFSCKKNYSCEGNCIENKPPVANAGPDQKIILPTDSVILDGSSSTDADGKIVSYKWKKIAGPVSSLIIKDDSSKTNAKTLVMGVYQFELKVTDNGGLSSKDTMQVIVDDPKINQPPITNAGPDQIITLPNNTVNLDGSGSTDPENNIISYAWSKISGPLSFNITNPNAAQTSVTNLIQGIYQFELKVSDAGNLFSKDTLQIMVNTSYGITSLGCNVSMSDISRLPTTGGVKYSVTAGTKILFTRYPGEVDIYDTVTHNWETVKGMYATQYYSSAQEGNKTAKVGSKIIFSGMADALDPARGQVVNIYDAASNSWSTTHLSQGRHFYAMAVVGNKVFYAGGNNDSKKIDIYDATTNSWSVADFIDSRRTGMAGISFGNKIYFAGGNITRYDSLVLECDDYGNNCHMVPAFVSTDRVDILDVSTNTWSVAHLSEARGGIISTAIVGNKIVFAGGERFPGGYSSKVDFYDVANNTWSSTNVGSPFVYDAYTVGNKLLITTGTETIHIYDATGHLWSTAQMPYAYGADIHEHGLVASVGNKLLFFLQFIGHDYSSRGIDIYDAISNTWCHTQLNFDLKRTGLVKVGNSIYIAGGITQVGCCIYNKPIDTVWHLDF